MAPLTKDTLEVANPVGESAVSHAATQTKPAAGHMRSDALSLEVAVRVHGSKVKEVVLGTTPHTEPFEEQTSTMIIFPQGGVLRMNTAVTVGQMLVLTNLKSRQDAICRVVKVRPNANLAAYIEVEFTQRQPGFWGVHFPSDVEAAPAQSAPGAPAVSAGAESHEKAKSISDISWVPAPRPSAAPSKTLESDAGFKETKPAYVPPPPPAERFVPAPKPEPSFISIGSQEEVQPAASSTAQISRKPTAFIPALPSSPTPTDFPSGSPAAPISSLSMSELRGEEDPAPLVPALATDTSVADEQALAVAAASPSENSRSTFGSFAGGNTLAAARSASTDDFGARLDSGLGESTAPGAHPRMNWMLIAAGAVVLITVLGGGLYFRNRSVNDRAASAHPPAAVQQPAQPAPPPDPSFSVPSPAVGSVAQPSSVPPRPAAPLNSANVATPIGSTNPSVTKPTAAATQQPIVSAKPVAPKVTPDMVSQSLNSHPAAAQRRNAGGSEAAPALDVPADSDGSNTALFGISSSPRVPALAPPVVPADVPARIGGDVKEPRLISSALPVYPLGAKQAGVEGNVVVNTTIDKNGNVVGMKIVSGPALLRQAALDALGRWKYEPSRLNGQPVAVQMQVTIKFHR
jgi:periplasmic protein TonB